MGNGATSGVATRDRCETITLRRGLGKTKGWLYIVACDKLCPRLSTPIELVSPEPTQVDIDFAFGAIGTGSQGSGL